MGDYITQLSVVKTMGTTKRQLEKLWQHSFTYVGVQSINILCFACVNVSQQNLSIQGECGDEAYGDALVSFAHRV